MSPVARRAPAAPASAPVAVGGVNFGELEFYTGGFNLPEGDYCLFFDVRMHQGVKQDGTPVGPERLGVMLAAYAIDPQGNKMSEEPQEKFFSIGSKAHLTYAPNPQTGKGLVIVPGGPGAQPNNSTNWALFLKSLYDCGMPKGVFTNDLTTVDGVWVHTQNIPEPEERKGYGQQTGEVEQEQRKGPNLIPIVTAILDNGKPWEGTGGLADTVAAPVAAPKTVARRPGPKAAPVAAAEVAAGVDEEAIKTATVNALGTLLGESPAGMLKLVLRTKVFSSIKEAEGEETAKAVAETIFSSDAVLNGVLAEVGYAVKGTQVVPL